MKIYLVRIKLQLNPDGTVIKSEILDHARMNKPGQGFYKVLAESALRAVKLCQPLEFLLLVMKDGKNYN